MKVRIVKMLISALLLCFCLSTAAQDRGAVTTYIINYNELIKGLATIDEVYQSTRTLGDLDLLASNIKKYMIDRVVDGILVIEINNKNGEIYAGGKPIPEGFDLMPVPEEWHASVKSRIYRQLRNAIEQTERNPKYFDKAFIRKTEDSNIDSTFETGGANQDVAPVKNVDNKKKYKKDRKEYVDLGLPSGTLWATMNIGASSPEDFGDYFAWGETSPKNSYDWNNYKWCDGDFKKLTKYCNDSIYGIVDGKTVLDRDDDAAFMNWGKEWCIPSEAQFLELKKECDWEWTRRNDVVGYLVTSKHNSATLFIPLSGYRSGDSITTKSWGNGIWLNELDHEFTDLALSCYKYLRDGMGCWFAYSRCFGRCVRPVRVSKKK